MKGEEEQTIDTIKKTSSMLAGVNGCRKTIKPGKRTVNLSEPTVINSSQKKQV